LPLRLLRLRRLLLHACGCPTRADGCRCLRTRNGGGTRRGGDDFSPTLASPASAFAAIGRRHAHFPPSSLALGRRTRLTRISPRSPLPASTIAIVALTPLRLCLRSRASSPRLVSFALTRTLRFEPIRKRPLTITTLRIVGPRAMLGMLAEIET